MILTKTKTAWISEFQQSPEMARGWATCGLCNNLWALRDLGFNGFLEGKAPKVDKNFLILLQHWLENVKALDGKLHFATQPLSAALLKWFSQAECSRDFNCDYANIEAAAADYKAWLGDYVLAEVAWKESFEVETRPYIGSTWYER